MVTFYWSRIKALKARLFETTGYREAYSALYREGNTGWVRSQAALRQLSELSRANGFDLKVVLLPELHELADYAFGKEHAMIMDFLGEIGVPALDLVPMFRDEASPQSLWVAMDDAHPNARAHGLIAEYAFDFIAEDAR